MLFILFGLLTCGVTALVIRFSRSTFGNYGHLISVLVIICAMPMMLYVYDEFMMEKGNIGDLVFGVILYVSVAIPACVTSLLSLYWYTPLRKLLGFQKEK